MVSALPRVIASATAVIPHQPLPKTPLAPPEATAAAPSAQRRSRLPAWLEITKPRLIPLLLATTLGGMAVSEAWPLPWPRLVACLLGGTFSAAAAGILNCLWEEELDRRMARTSGRALPAGRLSSRQALALAIGLTVTAVLVLTLCVNALAAALALLGLCSYVLLYTALLKPRTPQNIVIGGVAGAIPPLVGAAAASGHLGLGAWWLFTLVVLWTPAHFWALALLLREDYRAVGIPMLPVVHGPVVTSVAIDRYAWATVVTSLLGGLLLPSGGLLYTLLVLPFDLRLLQLTSDLRHDPDSPVRARAVFRWSILYLFGLSLLLIFVRQPRGEIFSLQWGQMLLALVGTA
ncbi:MAG: heme o synthase [Cyanobacteriota bacterium]